MAHDDKRLAEQIAQGDARAFAQFVDAYGGRVHRLARRYARTEADAEDLTQEIFVDLYRSLGRFRGLSSLATWVTRVALNHCLKYAERRRPDSLPLEETLPSPVDDAGNPVQASARRELGDQVQAALQGLTPEHRDVVILHELQELTYQECAALLSIPVGTVKSRLSYAIRRLRLALSGYVLGEGTDSLPPPVPLSETTP